MRVLPVTLQFGLSQKGTQTLGHVNRRTLVEFGGFLQGFPAEVFQTGPPTFFVSLFPTKRRVRLPAPHLKL